MVDALVTLTPPARSTILHGLLFGETHVFFKNYIYIYFFIFFKQRQMLNCIDITVTIYIQTPSWNPKFLTHSPLRIWYPKLFSLIFIFPFFISFGMTYQKRPSPTPLIINRNWFSIPPVYFTCESFYFRHLITRIPRIARKGIKI